MSTIHFDILELEDFIKFPSNPHDINQEKLFYYRFNNEEESKTRFIINNKPFKLINEGPRLLILKEALINANKESESGFYLKFGFCTGRTLNFIGAVACDSYIYGFESGNGENEGNELVYERNYAYTKTFSNQITDSQSNSLRINNNQGVTEIISLRNREKESEPPFIPFTPLCNVKLIIGDIESSLQQFIVNKLLSNDGSEGDFVEFLFIDFNVIHKQWKGLTVNILSLLSSYINEKTVIILDKSEKDLFEESRIEKKNIESSHFTSIENLYTQDTAPLNLKDFIQLPFITPAAGANQLWQEVSGKNVLHFNSKNRSIEFKVNETLTEIKQELRSHKAFSVFSDSHMLIAGVEYARKLWQNEYEENHKIYFLEFGFCSGRSINFISVLLNHPNEELYGFDSGNGLPNRWRHNFPKGTFRYTRQIVRNTISDTIEFHYRESDTFTPFIPFIPFSHSKEKLEVGLIADTLPEFIKKHFKNENDLKKENHHLALIFVDTDTREAADTIFEKLHDFIISKKTIIVLDEGYNFEGTKQMGDSGKDEWQKHEYDAMISYANKNKKKVRYLAYNSNGQQLMFYFEDL